MNDTCVIVDIGVGPHIHDRAHRKPVSIQCYCRNNLWVSRHPQAERLNPPELYVIICLFVLRRMDKLPRLQKVPTTRCQLIRSEEHTSELQSRPHLVCRLLLEKKKKNKKKKQ